MSNRLMAQRTEKITREIYEVEYEGKIYELFYISDEDDVYQCSLFSENKEIDDMELLELVEDFVQNEIVKTTNN